MHDETQQRAGHPHGADDATAAEDTRGDTVTLTGRHRRYVFRCAPGEERRLIAHVRALADDPDHTLAWYDAALLCHQLGKRLSMRLRTGHACHNQEPP